MATKPPAPAVKKTIPIVKSKGTAIMPWAAEMAAAAKKQAAVEKPMGLFKQVVIKSASMFIDEKQVPGNKARFVVLAATHENKWFNKPFNPAVPAVPACYAFGDQELEDPEAEMAPSPSVDDRQGFPEGEEQGGNGANCSNCWANIMGTADTGKGKACQNVRRLIVTTEDALDSADAMKNAEARSLSVPVMSVKNWVSFVHECMEEYQRPYWGVLVEVSVHPDARSQWQVKFTFQELITFDAELYAAVQKRVSLARKDIMTAYPKLEAQPEPPPKRGAKSVTSPPARKTSKY